MISNSYGLLENKESGSTDNHWIEEIAVKGFTIIDGIVSASSISKLRVQIDDIYAKQEEYFGKQTLEKIRDIDICRAPLLYSSDFIEIACHPIVTSIMRSILGEWAILNLQNAIISRPSQCHHQSAWHRDLPYQNFVSSKPLAVNALWVIDNFSEETGCTRLIPYSHKLESLPSEEYIEKNTFSVTALAGSVVLFDSMLVHKAGLNKSASIRRSLNHVYSLPILKQQYDFPRALGEVERVLNSDQKRLLGFSSQVPLSERQWRESRINRLIQ